MELLEQDNFFHIYNCRINGEDLFREEDNYGYFIQWFEKHISPGGSLFERPFKRKRIDNEEHLRNVVIYIHSNPVHHGFVDDISEWPWSSYSVFLTSEPTNLKRNEVIEMFDDLENFEYLHKQKME